MEEPEIEEGEACYYKEDASIDPDTDLSYIDEKIQSVLGHFQKDFEGGVSAEILGSKFGGYGSFLPVYEHSSSILSQPKTPQRVQNHTIPRSANNFPVEGAPQNSTTLSDAPLSQRLGIASCSLHSLQIAGVPSGNVSGRKGSCLSSGQAVQKFPLKHEPSPNKSVNPTNQRTLKFRIKVGSDSTAWKNAAIYSGLGLISPSSSTENSPAESSGMPFESQVTPDESPTSILQIMTSFPVPGDLLLSPLHNSLLSLIRKEKPSQHDKPMPAIKGSQEHSAVLLDGSATMLGDGKVTKDKRAKSVGKSETMVELKHGNDMDFEDNITSLLKNNTENETLERKQCCSSDMKLKTVSNATCNVGDTVKGAVMSPGAFREAERRVSVKKREGNKDGIKDRLFHTDFAKESSLESISGHDDGEYEKQEARSSSVEKIREHRVISSHKDDSVDLREYGWSKDSKISALFKVGSDVSKCKRDPNVGALDYLRQRVGQKATSPEHDEIKTPHGVEKSSFEGKRRSKGSQSNGKRSSDLAEESLMVGVYAVPNDKKKTNNMHNLKLQKDIRDTCDNFRDEQMTNQMNPLERPSGDRAKDSNYRAFEKESHALFDKSKERSSRKKVDNQLTSEKFLKEAANVGPPTGGGLASELDPTLVAPVVIEEDWVCCDRCQKWRLLPFGMKPDHLPEKWLCSMLNWLPGMNRCDISEEETTKALNAGYQVHLPENQNNLQNNADRTASGVTAADVRHFDHNHHNLSSSANPKRGKKKQASEETCNTASDGGQRLISNFTKNFLQEAVKSRSLNDMNQPLSESNLMNNSNARHLSKSCNFSMEKHIHKQKEKRENGGDAKKKKQKSKREADQCGYGATKKIKTEGAVDSDKYWTLEHSRNLDRVGRSSGIELPTKIAGENMQRHNEDYSSKDVKCDPKNRSQISVKKQGECAQISLDGGSLDIKTYNERVISVKKRKSKNTLDRQNYLETYRSNGKHLPDSKVSVKESSIDSELKKEKRSRVSSNEAKESSTTKGGDRSNKKGRITRILSAGIKDNPVHDVEDVRSIEKDQQPRKHRAKFAYKPTSDDVDSLKRDLGSEQFSMAATSSSSKVSYSRKTRANFRDVNGSPVESVSSSPLKTSNLDKLSPARRDLLGKDDVSNGDFPVVGSPRKSMDGEGNVESNRSGMAGKEKVSGVFHRDPLGFPVLDFQDRDSNNRFGGKAKSTVKHSEFGNSHLVNSDSDTQEQRSSCPHDLHASDHCHNEDRTNNSCNRNKTLFQQKSGKGSSSRSKEDRSSGSNLERVKVKVSDPPSEQEELNSKKKLKDEAEIGPHHLSSHREELSDIKCISKCTRDDNTVGKKGSRKWACDSRSENELKSREHDGSEVKLGVLCSAGGRVTSQQNLIQDFEGEIAKKINSTQIESRDGKSQRFPCHAAKQDTIARGHQPVPGLQQGSVFDLLPINASGDDDVSMVLKSVNQNGAHHILDHPVSNRCGVRDASGNTATDALKEAEDLRDYADHLKNSGFGFECNEAYFQAALKFLHGASLLETHNSDNSKHGEVTQMQIYSSTAKLCEICAREYEKRKEMAAAALAYKCMEVAYMRIVYCKHSITNRDRHDLQASLQMVSQGESPSSSASDVDNLNNQAMVDKTSLSKGISSYAGNHVNIARNRPNFARLLDFTKDVNSAMEASRKSQNAFAAANVILEEAQNKEGIISVKRVIEFCFQDVEELIRLVRLAIESIIRQGFSGSKD
ncbi:hypothetical protein F0562_034813 [Nyssa sinensis]|uniref:CW-type domain-containing protein n=1 Tax=Nyssa sinensis TaxID=561372 RepID=A0A5J5AC89_9ASTE|nr:hypothetical protein F0562_034813 [Nyssa sinensis]